MSPHPCSRKRTGNVLVLTVFALVGVFALMALAIDIGYLNMVDSELQRTADATAIAGAWTLYEQKELLQASSDVTTGLVRATAAEYAGKNIAGGVAPALAGQDVQVGFLANSAAAQAPLDTADPTVFNAVRVRVRRATDVNGEVPLFFARVLGFDRQGLGDGATAMYLNNFRGFRTPNETTKLAILPFALDRQTWDGMMAGGGTDSWKWDQSTKTITSGSDGVREVNLYPQGTGSPGNRGTVDIGASNNSTADLAQQILEGISAADLEDLGKPLELDANGQLGLNGDTGLSAGVKDELDHIKGQPRIIPIFDQVVKPGNNAEYRIVQFAGVRIMDVKLTGSMSSKRVIVQPAHVQVRGGIPGTENQTSQFISSPVWLVQ